MQGMFMYKFISKQKKILRTLGQKKKKKGQNSNSLCCVASLKTERPYQYQDRITQQNPKQKVCRGENYFPDNWLKSAITAKQQTPLYFLLIILTEDNYFTIL